ncbi:MAG: molybdate ABC transporter substrate-binding protein [Myxococcota bacterium]
MVTGAVRRQPPIPLLLWPLNCLVRHLVLGLCLVACTHTPQGDGVVRIHAASSLTELFEHLEPLFEAAHPGTDVVFSFAGSQVLRVQIAQGAPADIFVSANLAHVEALHHAGLTGPPRQVAGNTLAIIVPTDNPAKVQELEQLPRAQRIVLGTPHSPVGEYARALLAREDAQRNGDLSERVMARVVSEESNARLVRAKVALGEADAALVYATDARNTPNVIPVTLPPDKNIQVDYYAADIIAAAPPRAASLWRAFMASPQARAALIELGYIAP